MPGAAFRKAKARIMASISPTPSTTSVPSNPAPNGHAELMQTTSPLARAHTDSSGETSPEPWQPPTSAGASIDGSRHSRASVSGGASAERDDALLLEGGGETTSHHIGLAVAGRKGSGRAQSIVPRLSKVGTVPRDQPTVLLAAGQ